MAERTEADIAAELAEVDSALVKREVGDDVVIQSDPAEAEAEEEAGRKGWVPKDRFKGDPTKWKPASVYLEAGRRFEKNTQRELAELRSKYADLEKTGQAFAKFHEEAMARKDSEIAQAIKETRQRERQAVRDGDDDLAETLAERVELLKQEQAGIKQQVKDVNKEEQTIRQPDPAANLVVKEWVQDGNEWFNDDPELRQYALDIGNEMRRLGEPAQGREMLDKVAERVRKDFPRRFGKKQPTERRADQVSADAGSGTGSGGYSVHDLPAEDLALMKEGIQRNWFTKDQFLKNYFSGEKKTHKTRS
jgi:hypothetical protein